MSIRARLGVFSTALIGVMVGLFFYIQSPSCAFADNLCMVGETRTFANNIDIYGGTSYKTVLTTANTADRTITLPDASSGLIGATSTDTLTNKRIDFLTGGNTGTNYDANTLTGATLPANVVTSSLQNLGVQSQVELGSIGTTLTEPSAGNVAIETKEIYRANGVTIPVDDGGTGVTSLPTGHALIGDDANPITTVDMTTQGDLLVGDGTGPPSVLAVGANGEFLTADSAEPTGVKWGAPPAGGYSVVDCWLFGNATQTWASYYPGPSRTAVRCGTSEGFRNNGHGNVGSMVSMPNNYPSYARAYQFAETGYYDITFQGCSSTMVNNAVSLGINGTNNSWSSHAGIGEANAWQAYVSGYRSPICAMAEAIMKVTTTTDSYAWFYQYDGSNSDGFQLYQAGFRIWIKKIADL